MFLIYDYSTQEWILGQFNTKDEAVTARNNYVKHWQSRGSTIDNTWVAVYEEVQ